MKPCILPWINFGTNTFGRVRVCGYSDFKAHWKQIFIDRGYSGITSLQDLKGSNSDIKLSDDISKKEKIRENSSQTYPKRQQLNSDFKNV